MHWTESPALEDLGKIGAGANYGLIMFMFSISAISCSAGSATVSSSSISVFPNHASTALTYNYVQSMFGGRCRTSDTNLNLTCKVVETSQYDFPDGFPVYLATASRTWGGAADADGYQTTFDPSKQVTYSHNRAFVM